MNYEIFTYQVFVQQNDDANRTTAHTSVVDSMLDQIGQTENSFYSIFYPGKYVISTMTLFFKNGMNFRKIK